MSLFSFASCLLTIFDINSDKRCVFYTVYPGSSDPAEKIFNIFVSENEVYTIY